MPMPDPGSFTPLTAPPTNLGASVRAHWLVRLGARAVVLGVSPLMVYGAWTWVTDGPASRSVNLGVLAFVGLGLGAVLLVSGTLAVLVARARERHARPPRRR